MRIVSILIALLSISSAFANARADVSLRNGNFFVAFRDISYPGGLEPKLERFYNSKSDFQGMFGYSWGTEYETKINVEADGSIVVSEFGGGAENRFVPKNYQAGDAVKSVDVIVDAAKKAGVVSTAQQVQTYKAKLIAESDFRSKQYQIFISKGFLPKKAIPEGTQLTSSKFLYSYITKVKGGFVRNQSSGLTQKFDDAGKLVQISDKNKNFINFAYNANNRIVSLVDNQNRKMQFAYNPQGRLEKVIGESGKSATYKYNKLGFLEYSKDEAGIENGFKYTDDTYRNMTEITYFNEKDAKGQVKRLQIAYYGPEKTVNVKSVINPDGTKNEYDYLKDPKNPGFYGVRILMKNGAGAKISDAKYDYYSKTQANGDSFTLKMVSDVDGDKQETTYDEKLGFPVKINNNGRLTTMTYDIKGRMVKKVTPVETTELSYHPAVGKVSKVSRKLKSGTVLWSMFDWDVATGNLILAKNSEKKQVKLIYDQAGRIRALVDQTGRQLTFKYNELSKPIEIADAKLGTIKITYKNSGEVDKMESNGGSSAASEVLRALQNLIDITAPAGVTMSI